MEPGLPGAAEAGTPGAARPDRPGRTDPRTEQGPRWRQTSFGFHVPGEVDPTVPEQRILEQSVRLPPHGAVTGWASCRLRGAAYFDGLEADGTTMKPVPLAVGPRAGVRGDGQVVISRDQLDPSEVRLVHGIPCTSTLRGLFDELRGARDLREAVVAMDMMAAAELVSIRRMREYVAARAGWRGVPQVRAALDLADEDSRSPNETRTRLIWAPDGIAEM